jgi:tripartite-type tricarboxylate transporter receptor subunit TctC
MLASLRSAPGRLVFGVGADAWSKTALAALVDAVHPPGRVPFRVLPTAGAAAISTSGDTADVVVAPRGELRARSVTARLRVLAHGDVAGSGGAGGADAARLAGGSASPRLADLLASDAPVVHAHRWIALFAPPGTSAPQRRELAARVRAMVRGRGWRTTLRRLALERPPDVAAGPYLARAARDARALAAAARRVPEAPVPRAKRTASTARVPRTTSAPPTPLAAR